MTGKPKVVTAKKAADTNKEDNNIIITINGLVIKEDSLYQIENKLDKSAPDGFIKEGTTKLPSEGIGNTVGCRYVDKGNGKGLYDTGFYLESPCYTGLTDEAKTAIVKKVREKIVKPYENLQNSPELLNVANHEFWDSLSIDLYDGRVFNTENIQDLFELYIAMRSFDLTPVSKEGAPEFNQSDYMIKDSSEVMSSSKRRAKGKMDATYNFMTLLNLAPEKLINIMKYLNVVRVGEKPAAIDLQTIFGMWLDKDVQNVDVFMNAFKKAESPEGESELALFVKVKKLVENRKIVREGSDLLFEGTPIGIDTKSVVYNLMNDEELLEISERIRMS